jgi:hypothetical protein
LTKTEKYPSTLRSSLELAWITTTRLTHKVSGGKQGHATYLMLCLGFTDFGLFDQFSSSDMTAKDNMKYAGLIDE